MAEKPKQMIGVIAAEVNSIEQRQIVKGIITRAQEVGRRVVVFSNLYNPYEYNEDLALENQIYDLMYSPELCGLVLIMESFISEKLREILRGMLEKRQDIPVAAIGVYLDALAFPNVRFIDSDDARDMEDVTVHLLDEHHLTKVDILTGFEGNPAAERRVQGYRKALEDRGIPFEPERVHYGNFWTDSGENLAKRYVSGELPLPQAVICANDYMAYGMLDTFLQNGIHVPADVIVTGYEYIHERIYHSPMLATYQRGREALGREAVTIIDCLAKGEEPPSFVPPVGAWIAGDSCPCGVDAVCLHAELEELRVKQQYDKWNVLGTVEQQLTVCSTLADFIRILGEHQFLVRWVQNMYLCLCGNWYDTDDENIDDVLTCRSVMPWNTSQPAITCHRHDFHALFANTPEGAVHYYLPVFFRKHMFGYYVLEYHNPDTYDDIFRNWMKSLSNGLEFLCMKNDIRYLLQCQSLSEQHDSLTGLYNQRGFESALSARLSSAEQPMYIIALKTDVLQSDVSPEMQVQQTARAQQIAEILRNTAKQSGIIARLDAHVYVIADFPCTSDDQCDFYRQKLLANLIARTDLTETVGIESVLCVGTAIAESSAAAATALLREQLRSATEPLMRLKNHPHAGSLFAVRNQLYREHTLTMETVCRKYSFSAGYFRQIYKSCFQVSFHQDAINARIYRAIYLLSDTVLSIASIAEQCGYEDYNYFLRQFQKITGMSPGQYRRQMT